MTEEEAQRWVCETFDVPRETIGCVAEYIRLLLDANDSQNLIGASTVATLWDRHIADSAQLLLHAPSTGHWVDIGSGAGLPGLIVAIIGEHMVTLVESRPLRADFLRQTAAALGLANVDVVCAPVETVCMPPVAVLSARAVAPLGRLFKAALHLADADTIWLLPKGRSAASELAAARDSWQGMFAMKPSVTDPEAAIIVARHIARRVRA